MLRFPLRFDLWVGAALAVSLPMSVAQAADTSAGARSLPPVVELGEAPSSAAPARDTLADLLLQLETLQTELRQLRGQVEVQTNEIERLKLRQRELLADVDRRVRELERRAEIATAPETTTPTNAETGTVARPPSGPVPVPNVSASEQQDYDAAFALLKQGFYERAAKGFRDFIAKHPRSPLKDNAQYWMGEAYYVLRNFRQAQLEFSRLASDYPKSLKMPDALLKTAYSHYELGEWAKARAVLNQVITAYPDSAFARSAEQRLAKMKKEGHLK